MPSISSWFSFSSQHDVQRPICVLSSIVLSFGSGCRDLSNNRFNGSLPTLTMIKNLQTLWVTSPSLWAFNYSLSGVQFVLISKQCTWDAQKITKQLIWVEYRAPNMLGWSCGLCAVLLKLTGICQITGSLGHCQIWQRCLPCLLCKLCLMLMPSRSMARIIRTNVDPTNFEDNMWACFKFEVTSSIQRVEVWWIGLHAGICPETISVGLCRLFLRPRTSKLCEWHDHIFLRR
jgi:hypothetical protein